MVPSSWMSICVPVSLVIAWITEPPLPITSRILSGWILMVIRRGANSLSSWRGAVIAWAISPRICSRPAFACVSACFMISSVMPSILMSICSADTPLAVPATLKSMSPRWSSSPRMSLSTTKSSPSFTRPIAMPATGALIGTPASISASELPQTEAIEDEPFDSVISETTRIVYGNSSIVGITASTPRLARRPWPISRRFGPIMRPASPTENGGSCSGTGSGPSTRRRRRRSPGRRGRCRG